MPHAYPPAPILLVTSHAFELRMVAAGVVDVRAGCHRKTGLKARVSAAMEPPTLLAKTVNAAMD
jgi:hypothetical protein